MRFPNARLRTAGYRFRFGMAAAHAMALEALRREAGPAASAVGGKAEPGEARGLEAWPSQAAPATALGPTADARRPKAAPATP
jgi:hypothetical protein